MRECHQGSWLKDATAQKPNIDSQSIDQSTITAPAVWRYRMK